MAASRLTLHRVQLIGLAPALTASLLLAGCQKPTDAPAAGTPPTPAATPAPLPGADALYALVAPIALFPDPLVAQTLAAATHPDQVTLADQWLHANAGLSADARSQAANTQPWDPSLKALTQFPDVLDQLAQNLPWTTALGQAYAGEPTDVLNAIQVMRGRAQAHGALRDTPQQRIRTQPRPLAGTANGSGYVVPPPAQTIVIEPTQPDVVYVPRYDPDVVYGAPVYVAHDYGYRRPRSWDTGELVATGVVSFGLGILLADSWGHDRWHRAPPPAWGWNAWNVNWAPPPGAPGYVGYRQQPLMPPTTLVQNHIDRRTYIQNSTVQNNVHIDNRRYLNSAPQPVPTPLRAPHFDAAMLHPGRPVAALPMTMNAHPADTATRPVPPVLNQAGTLRPAWYGPSGQHPLTAQAARRAVPLPTHPASAPRPMTPLPARANPMTSSPRPVEHMPPQARMSAPALPGDARPASVLAHAINARPAPRMDASPYTRNVHSTSRPPEPHPGNGMAHGMPHPEARPHPMPAPHPAREEHRPAVVSRAAPAKPHAHHQ